MEQNGDSGQHQEGTPWPMLQSPLVTQSVTRAYIPSRPLLTHLTKEQVENESKLRAELDAIDAEERDLDLQLAVAKKKAENGERRRLITLFNRVAHRCERCYYAFNVLQEDGKLKVRARTDKHVCDKDLGDPECVKEQQQERDQARRAEQKAAEHQAQQPKKKTSRAKHLGSRQPVSTNGHRPVLSARDEEER